VDRAERGDVLGIEMLVAFAREVLQGKVWAAQDLSRRPSKIRKDLLDIEGLTETHPAWLELVPPEILQQIEP
jgi:hypothetical protein